jgi:acyl-CoA thioester hydrolase
LNLKPQLVSEHSDSSLRSELEEYKFSILIPVRFGDMDALGHVNNAKYLTYFEEARLAYWMNLFPLEMSNVAKFSFILADAKIGFRSAAKVGEKLRVSIRVTEVGNKSFRMEYRIANDETKQLVAEGSTVQVMYDYEKETTIAVPDDVKKKILKFESTS